MAARFAKSISLLCPLVLGVLLVACSQSPTPKHYTEADIVFLASDAHVIVGDVALVVPFVALSGYVGGKLSFSFDKQADRKAAKERMDAFRLAASHDETAPSVDSLEVAIRTYGWDDSETSVIRLCARLTRQWSRSVCNDPWAPLQQALPNGLNRFYLADDRKLDTFRSWSTVGGEQVLDQLLAMRLQDGEASITCDKKVKSSTRFCTAAMPVRQHLVAVWTVWNGVQESADQQAKREGMAIRALVLDGLRQTENFPSLLSAACALKRPDAPLGIHKSPCANL